MGKWRGRRLLPSTSLLTWPQWLGTKAKTGWYLLMEEYGKKRGVTVHNHQSSRLFFLTSFFHKNPCGCRISSRFYQQYLQEMNPKWLQSAVTNVLHTGACRRGGELHMSFQLHLTSVFLHKNNFSLVASSPFSKHLKSSQIGSCPELLFFAFCNTVQYTTSLNPCRKVRNWIYIYI